MGDNVVELPTKAGNAEALARDCAMIFKAFIAVGFTPDQAMDLLFRVLDRTWTDEA